MTDKWCENWEKNFDSSLKALNKFKDDMKTKPMNLKPKTQQRCEMYLRLIELEVQELLENFKGDKGNHAQIGKP